MQHSSAQQNAAVAKTAGESNFSTGSIEPLQGVKIMKRVYSLKARGISTFRLSLLRTLCLGLSGHLLVASAAENAAAPSATASPATQRSAQKCMNDLRVLDREMQTDGNWLHGAGFGYGYPAYGYGHGYGIGHGYAAPVLGTTPGNPVSSGYSRARPGYEIRTLIASATILAERGQQPQCDALLTTARGIYKGYADDLRDGKMPRGDGMNWRRTQIAAALPVVGSKLAYRSDQLIGADVVNPQGDDLGDVYDVVMNPETGNISYLVLGRGGVFGIGERHVPVPWDAFKVTAGNSMMVLDTTKSNLDAAPRVQANHFSRQGNVGQQGQNADAFWKSSILK